MVNAPIAFVLFDILRQQTQNAQRTIRSDIETAWWIEFEFESRWILFVVLAFSSFSAASSRAPEHRTFNGLLV